MKKVLILILAAMCVSISACTLYRITSEDTSRDYYPPKSSADEVQYLETAKRPHTVIGSVVINAERNQSLKEIIEKMKYEASQLGGDAISNIQTDGGTGVWARIKPKLFKNSNVRANFSADVIVFK